MNIWLSLFLYKNLGILLFSIVLAMSFGYVEAISLFVIVTLANAIFLYKASHSNFGRTRTSMISDLD